MKKKEAQDFIKIGVKETIKQYEKQIKMAKKKWGTFSEDIERVYSKRIELLKKTFEEIEKNLTIEEN